MPHTDQHRTVNDRSSRQSPPPSPRKKRTRNPKMFYVFCRAWMGFSDEFPFDEFNDLPDEQICQAIEDKALGWLRADRRAVRKRIRDKIKELTKAMDRYNSQAISTPNPHRGLSHSGPPKRQIQFLLGQIRGERTQTLGVRIARIADWIDSSVESFGGLSPSHRLVVPLTDHETAQAVIKVLRERFARSDYSWLMLHFGCLPAQKLSLAEKVIDKRRLEEAKAGTTDEPEAEIHSVVAEEAERAFETVKTIRAHTAGPRGVDGVVASTDNAVDGSTTPETAATRQKMELPKPAGASAPSGHDLPPDRGSSGITEKKMVDDGPDADDGSQADIQVPAYPSPGFPSVTTDQTDKHGMSWKEAQKEATRHVKRNGYPGLRTLATIVHCSPATMLKAVQRSTYLTARQAEHKVERGGKPRETALTNKMHDDVNQGTEPNPLDSLIAEQEADDDDHRPLDDGAHHCRSR